MDFEYKSVMEGRVDNEARRVEGIGKNLVQVEVPRAGFSLICHKNKDRIRTPLIKFHLGNTRAHAPDIPRERIGKQVLACTV